jgi:hypothetical protein
VAARDDDASQAPPRMAHSMASPPFCSIGILHRIGGIPIPPVDHLEQPRSDKTTDNDPDNDVSERLRLDAPPTGFAKDDADSNGDGGRDDQPIHDKATGPMWMRTGLMSMVPMGCSVEWIPLFPAVAGCAAVSQRGLNHSLAEGRGRLDLRDRRTQASREVSELGEIDCARSACSDVSGQGDFVRGQGDVECCRDGEIEDEGATRGR